MFEPVATLIRPLRQKRLPAPASGGGAPPSFQSLGWGLVLLALGSVLTGSPHAGERAAGRQARGLSRGLTRVVEAAASRPDRGRLARIDELIQAAIRDGKLPGGGRGGRAW